MNIEIPNEQIFGEDIRHLLEHPNLQMRGDNYFREAIRYFQAPYGDIHQETIESGNLHQKQARLTFSILRSLSPESIAEVVWEMLEDWIKRLKKPILITNLFVEIRPLMISIVFKLLFNQNISPEKLEIYARAVANLHDTLKGNALRCLPIRWKMYEDIKQQLQIRPLDRFFQEKDLEGIDSDTFAKHISCVFFHTAVVQTTEFICHTLVAICQHQEVEKNLRQYVDELNWLPKFEAIANYDYLDYVLNESLRLFPLLGKTNRQVTKTFTSNGVTFEKDSVIYLNFHRNHRLHWDEPETFKPNRWDDHSAQATPKQIRKENFIPFGVGPRSCPAESFARNTTKTVIIGILKYIDLKIPPNFVHTRRIPQGVPVVISLNPSAQKIRADINENKSREVTVNDLLISLEKQLEFIDESESVELNITKIFGKIIRDLKNSRFNFTVFYPLIRDIDIWLNFQRKQIKKFLR